MRQLFGIVEAKRASAGVVSTTSFFTRGARELQRAIPFRLGLQDFTDVTKMLREALDALDYLAVLAEVQPERAQAAALRWHGRLELESVALSLVESQLALAALASLCAGDRDALAILQRFVRRVRPALVRRMG